MVVAVLALTFAAALFCVGFAVRAFTSLASSRRREGARLAGPLARALTQAGYPAWESTLAEEHRVGAARVVFHSRAIECPSLGIGEPVAVESCVFDSIELRFPSSPPDPDAVAWAVACALAGQTGELARIEEVSVLAADALGEGEEVCYAEVPRRPPEGLCRCEGPVTPA